MSKRNIDLNLSFFTFFFFIFLIVTGVRELALFPQVRLNDMNANPPLFSSGQIGRDNSIARHGIHGLYWLFNIEVPGTLLVEGENTIFLTQPKSTSPFQGIMYDYIRLEGPPDSDTKKE